MRAVPLDFIVLGLPRSGTTWLANWLTTESSLCLHDPFAVGMPDSWPADERRRGISCTGAWLMPHWLGEYTCPIAVIERDPASCDRSLAQLGLPPTSALIELFEQAPGRRFAFESLWDEDGARALWDYLLPAQPFDPLRYRLLRAMHVQPTDPGKVDMDTVQHLVAAGLLEGRL